MFCSWHLLPCWGKNPAINPCWDAGRELWGSQNTAKRSNGAYYELLLALGLPRIRMGKSCCKGLLGVTAGQKDYSCWHQLQEALSLPMAEKMQSMDASREGFSMEAGECCWHCTWCCGDLKYPVGFQLLTAKANESSLEGQLGRCCSSEVHFLRGTVS